MQYREYGIEETLQYRKQYPAYYLCPCILDMPDKANTYNTYPMKVIKTFVGKSKNPYSNKIKT